MKAYVKVGYEELRQTAGLQSVTGLGFTPKLVLFFSNPDTADIVSAIANGHWSYGAFDGTNQWCRAGGSINGRIFGQLTASLFNKTSVINIFDPPGTTSLDYSASAVSLDSDGFTINVTNPPPINYRFGYMAIGGTTFQAYVNTFQTAGGGQTVSGIPFTPEAVLTMTTPYFTALPQIGNGFSITMGCCTNPIGFDNPTNYTLSAPMAYNPNPSQSKRQHNVGWSIEHINVAGSIIVGGGIFSFIPGAFTTGYYANPTGVHVGYIAMAGSPDILFYSSQDFWHTSVGTKYISGIGFTPRGIMFNSVSLINPALGLQSDARACMGVTGDNPDERFMMMFNDYDAQSPSLTNHATHSQRIYRNINSGSVIEEEADIHSYTADGFNIDQIVASATPSKFGFFVIGDTDSPPPPVTTDNSFGIIV